MFPSVLLSAPSFLVSFILFSSVPDEVGEPGPTLDPRKPAGDTETDTDPQLHYCFHKDELNITLPFSSTLSSTLHTADHIILVVIQLSLII